MHESHLLEHIFKYLDDEQRVSGKKIRGMHIALSDFGGISQEHFMQHYRESAAGSRWEALEITVNRVPYGPELEITKIVYANPCSQN